jgi:hypothetical protein
MAQTLPSGGAGAFPAAPELIKQGLRRVGQNHKYTVYIRYCWQGNHQIYGHIRYYIRFWPTLDLRSFGSATSLLLALHTNFSGA